MNYISKVQFLIFQQSNIRYLIGLNRAMNDNIESDSTKSDNNNESKNAVGGERMAKQTRFQINSSNTLNNNEDEILKVTMKPVIDDENSIDVGTSGENLKNRDVSPLPSTSESSESSDLNNAFIIERTPTKGTKRKRYTLDKRGKMLRVILE